MSQCGQGMGWLVRYGEWVEIYGEEGNFLTSFKVRSNMCKDQLTRYLNMYLDIEVTEYSVKRIANRR